LYRGTKIINEALVMRVQQRKAHEANVVNKIKKKLERIKLRQGRLGKVTESTDHYIGQFCFFLLSLVVFLVHNSLIVMLLY